MTYHVKIDGTTATGKKLIQELKKYPDIVKFDNPAEMGIVPEGYMTGDEFSKNVKDRLKELYKSNGLLQ